MEAGSAFWTFILLGVIFGLVGLGLYSYEETQTIGISPYVYTIAYHPHILTGSILFGLASSWFIVGFVFLIANREVDSMGLFAGFVFGVLGAILWLILGKQEGTQVSSEISDKGQLPLTEFTGEIKTQRMMCETCLYFGNPILCPYKEKNAQSLACVHFKSKETM